MTYNVFSGTLNLTQLQLAAGQELTFSRANVLGILAVGVQCTVAVYYHCCVCRLSQEGGRSRRAAATTVSYKEPTLGRQALCSLCECCRIMAATSSSLSFIL